MTIKSDEIYDISLLPENVIIATIKCLDYSILGYFQCSVIKDDRSYISQPVTVYFSHQIQNYDTSQNKCLDSKLTIKKVLEPVFRSHMAMNISWKCDATKTFEVVVRELKSCSVGPIKIYTSHCSVKVYLRRGTVYYVWVMEAAMERVFKPVSMATHVALRSVNITDVGVFCDKKHYECELVINLSTPKVTPYENYYLLIMDNITMTVTDFEPIRFKRYADEPMNIEVKECSGKWCFQRVQQE